MGFEKGNKVGKQFTSENQPENRGRKGKTVSEFLREYGEGSRIEFEGIHTVVNADLNMFQAVYDKEFGFHDEFTDCSGITHWLELVPDSELEVFKEIKEFLKEVKDGDYSMGDAMESLDYFYEKIQEIENENPSDGYTLALLGEPEN